MIIAPPRPPHIAVHQTIKYFCTYFDRNYLTRGLALFESLRKHCPVFKLWVLCFDEESYNILSHIRKPGLEPIALADLLSDDPALAAVRSTRSPVEFYFTCTPSLLCYLFGRHAEIDILTYLDADLFFYSDLEPLFTEIGSASISIIAHRFPPSLHDLVIFGIYNVGFLSFRRDVNGLACLEWWRDRCNEWCYARLEGGRYGDQKYLDDWPTRFANVHVLQHPGANVALWNVANHAVTCEDRTVRIGEHPLVFFHFHALLRLRPWLYELEWDRYRLQPDRTLTDHIFVPYLRALGRAERMVAPLRRSGRRPQDLIAQPNKVLPARPAMRHRLSAKYYNLCRLINGILRRQYIATLWSRPIVLPFD